MAKTNPNFDPQFAAGQWAQGLSGAGPKIERGVRAVQQAPGQLAAAARDKYLYGVQQNVDVWATRVAGVSLGDWQNATIAGAGRVAEGASRKQGKYATAVAPVFQHAANVHATVRAMPSTSLDQRIQRSVAWQRGMAQFRQRG